MQLTIFYCIIFRDNYRKYGYIVTSFRLNDLLERLQKFDIFKNKQLNPLLLVDYSNSVNSVVNIKSIKLCTVLK